MSDFDSTDSVRNANPLKFVQTQVFRQPLRLESKAVLPEITVAYETYGTLNDTKDNAVLLCHALSGDSHVAAHDETDDSGWWEIMVGPNKPIDTDKYFVICTNVFGGCRGTTGPDCIDPQTGKRYGMNFPEITVGDIVEVQGMLIDYLGISRLLAVVGGSLGGICTLEWSIRFPDRILSAVCLAAGAHLTSQSLAFDIVARNAIQSDPNYHQGQYHDNGVVPANGLAIARMLGHITYLSRESMMKKFDADRNQGRKLDTKFETKFSVGSYLAYQGERFVDRFDANSYITISTAIDNFNLGNTQEELKRKLRKAMCRWLILSFSTDWLFPPFLSKDLTAVLLSLNKQVNYCNIPSEFGHDAFLLPNDFALYGEMIRAFLADNFIKNHGGKSTILQQNIEEGVAEVSLPSLSKARFDFNQILDLIPLGASVLDLGCGGGELLTQIRENSNSQVLGLEISEQKVLKCIGRGIDVVQADLNYGLNVFEDDQFDFVILSKTLQTITDVELVLSEMLRVGTRCIVSFPNLGYDKYRRRLSEEGRAPCIRHGDSPEKWYNTEDVRFLTLADFEDFCEEKKIRIHYSIPLDTNSLSHITENPNQNADVVIMVISR